MAKFWLDPLTPERKGGFAAQELNSIARVVEEHRNVFLEEWDAFFRR